MEALARVRGNVRPEGVKEMTVEDKKFFLVNLSEDPGESKNWATEHPHKVSTFSGLAKEFQDNLGSSRK